MLSEARKKLTIIDDHPSTDQPRQALLYLECWIHITEGNYSICLTKLCTIETRKPQFVIKLITTGDAKSNFETAVTPHLAQIPNKTSRYN